MDQADVSKHVGAAAAGFQQELVDQLKAPGRFVDHFRFVYPIFPFFLIPLLNASRIISSIRLEWHPHPLGARSLWTQLIRSFRRLFIPIEERSEYSGDLEQHIYVIDKDENGNVTTKKEYGVRYVPLKDAPK